MHGGSLKCAWEVEDGWVGGVMGSRWVGTCRHVLNMHGGGRNGIWGGHEWVMWVSEPRDQKMTKLVQLK